MTLHPEESFVHTEAELRAALRGRYTIRPARDSDCRFIYDLSMDPRIRAASTRSEEFTYEEHKEWWRRKRTNGLNAIWVMEVGAVPVAQVRYGKALGATRERIRGASPIGRWREGDLRIEAEIAISVVPSHWRKGYAQALLQETMPMAREWLKVDTLVALVLRNNYASRRLFRRAGFRYVGVECRMERIHARYEVSA